MPADVVQKLNTHIAEILRDPAIQQAFRTKGDLAASATVPEFTAIVDADLKKWGDAARKIGLKNE
jgi:tripartite-type tricarboxylate transporter receptor subunit TctC